MIPRVFVSSTYYDLKHVRERIEKFIDSYGFEPVLFESDKITYQHEKEIDNSAYFEVELCQIMVLIVGGRYGTPTTQSKQEEERRAYDEYISITRKEFETAIHKNIPILIFVDKNVHSEYQTYKENQEYFEELYLPKTKDDLIKKKFKFAHVDHINVFRFIDVIRSKPFKTFEKVEEIETYIKAQLSGMFYLYLESLKKKSDDNKILDTIAELNNVTLRMNEMLSSVGKEILGSDKKEYEKVIEAQLLIMIDFFGDQIGTSLEFEYEFNEDEITQIDIEEIAKTIYENGLKINIPKPDKKASLSDWLIFSRKTDDSILQNIQEKLSSIHESIVIKEFQYRNLNHVLHTKVLPFIKEERDEKLIIKRISTVIKDKLSELPF